MGAGVEAGLGAAMKIVKCLSIPILLIASLFACCAASYEPLVDFAIWVGAIILIWQAIRLQQYFFASGFLAIAIVFTPLSLIVKIVLLLGVACLAVLRNLVAAFDAQQPQPAEVAL